MSSSSKRFFKIILNPALQDHKLRIPVPFVNKYGDELSDSVSLMVPTGGVWLVSIKRMEDSIWLCEGFQKFIKDHSIELGYFCVFKYKGNSTFKVNIFDLSALEIEYPNSSDCARINAIFDQKKEKSIASAERWKQNKSYVRKSKRQEIKVEEVIEATSRQGSIPPRGHKVHQSNTCMQEPTPDPDRKINSSTNEKGTSSKCKSVGHKISLVGKSPVEVQVNRAIKVENVSLPETPSFKRTIESYTCKSNNVSIPAKFAKLYLPFPLESVQLLDADDNEWEVRCYRNGTGASYLSKGWSKFAEAKELREGDVCVFELIQFNEQVKLKVKISRART